MGSSLRLLLIEDSEDDALLIVQHLKRGGYSPEWKCVDEPSELVSSLDQEEWDVIIADHNLPRFDSLAALDMLNERNLDMPFIIVSGAWSRWACLQAASRMTSTTFSFPCWPIQA